MCYFDLVCRKFRIFARRSVRERAAPQQLELVPLCSACTVLAPKEQENEKNMANKNVIDPIDFTPDTIQGILPKEFALELVRRYKEVIAPLFDPAMKVMMFGSYAKDCPNEWSDIDVAVILPKVDRDNWWDTAVTLGRATDNISSYIEPILLESGEDSPIYREVMRTGVAV